MAQFKRKYGIGGGSRGPQGPAGPPGPPGGAVLSGKWLFSPETTGPADTGQIRTEPSLSDIQSVGQMWISTIDADGLDWSPVTINVGDRFYIRADGGEMWVLDITSTGGPDNALNVTLVSTTGQAPKRNERVQVSLVPGTPAPV